MTNPRAKNTEDIIQVAHELGLKMRDDPRVNQDASDAISAAVCLLSTLMAADIITSIGPDFKDRYIDITLKFVKKHVELDLKWFREQVL